jgi:hypothetical protein
VRIEVKARALDVKHSPIAGGHGEAGGRLAAYCSVMDGTRMENVGCVARRGEGRHAISRIGFVPGNVENDIAEPQFEVAARVILFEALKASERLF